MAIYLNNNVGVKLATSGAPTVPSINISSYVTGVTLTMVVDELEVTAMGDTAHKFAAGLQAATLSIDFLNSQNRGSANASMILYDVFPQTITPTTFSSTPDYGLATFVAIFNFREYEIV